MKRHPALEPFSRDHNTGLVLARNLQLGREYAVEELREAWERELRDHFDEEERLLGPLLTPEMRSQLVREHQMIATAIAELPGGSMELGNCLHDHIRWEERAMFPAIERTATEAQLHGLAQDTAALEARRWEHDIQRSRLVQKRIDKANTIPHE